MKRCADPDCLACTTGIRPGKYIPDEYLGPDHYCECGALVPREGLMCDDCWADLLATDCA